MLIVETETASASGYVVCLSEEDRRQHLERMLADAEAEARELGVDSSGTPAEVFARTKPIRKEQHYMELWARHEVAEKTPPEELEARAVVALEAYRAADTETKQVLTDELRAQIKVLEAAPVEDAPVEAEPLEIGR